MGGIVDVEAEKGEGSRFTVQLPKANRGERSEDEDTGSGDGEDA